MNFNLDIDWPAFLNEYWQKKPVVLKKAFQQFVDPITVEELAGLAMEDEIDSRLVSFSNNHWHVSQGPFTQFDHLAESDWVLLVQSVDHWHEHAAKLVTPFTVLPYWRFDDLMIAYSVPGGSVGPHIDQYGVFIIQGYGRRHWRVGEKNPNYHQFCPHPSLLHVEEAFTAIIDEELTSGDILYIPPGFPHEGQTIETAMSYSIGYRAANGQNFISSFADYLIANDLGLTHYDDPELILPKKPYQVSNAELNKVKSMMASLLEQDYFSRWFGEYVSQSSHELDIIELDTPFNERRIVKLLENDENIKRVNGLKVLSIGDDCFIDGERYLLTAEQIDLLARQPVIKKEDVIPYLDDHNFIKTLTFLINKGYWFFLN